MGINLLIALVQLILFLWTVYLLGKQGRHRLALPSGQQLRNGDLHEWVRLFVQVDNVRRPV